MHVVKFGVFEGNDVLISQPTISVLLLFLSWLHEGA